MRTIPVQDRKLLTKAPIPGLIRSIAVPVSIGFFFNTMYNVVDTYFAGLLSTTALAALSLSFPVFFIIVAVGNGMAVGTTALIGNALGAGASGQARLYGLQGLSFGLLLSLLLAAFGLWASPFLFALLGAEGTYLETCMEYMHVIFLGAPFFLLVFLLNAVLNAHGNTRPYRNFLILGFVLNVILDPWFTFGGLGVPAMGVRGIALATVLIQAIGCLYLARHVRGTGLFENWNVKETLPRFSAFRDIAGQGVPASVNYLTIGLGIFVITFFVSRFGQEAVAAYGAAMRIEQIALMPAIGLNVATLSLVAQNFGAGKLDRIKEALHRSLLYGALLMAIGGAAVFLFGGLMMDLFTRDTRVIDIGRTYLRIDALVLYAYVVIFVNLAALQGIKRPMFAIWIGLFRQVVAPLLLFTLTVETLGFGLLSIWWGIFAITWTAAGLTVLYTRRMLKRVAGVTVL